MKKITKERNDSDNKDCGIKVCEFVFTNQNFANYQTRTDIRKI